VRMPTHDPEQQPPSRQERLRTQWGRFSVRRRFSSSRSAGVREASGAGSPVREAVAAFERRFSSSRSAGVREASGAGSPVREAVAAFEAVSAAARTAHGAARSAFVARAWHSVTGAGTMPTRRHELMLTQFHNVFSNAVGSMLCNEDYI
jgi:hypothetical protein